MNEKTDRLNNTPSRIRFIDALLVMGISLWSSCFFLGQGLLAGTEGHRGLVADQMVHSGRWLLPRLYDQLYFAKPPLDYWLLAGVEKVTGRADALIWRLPSAVEGALLAAFLCLITGRWYGRLGGVVAGVAYCSLLALWAQNHTAEIDSLNSLACIVCACLVIDMGWGPRRPGATITMAAGLALGATLMVKGPAGMTVVGGALFGPAIFNRTRQALKQKWPWIALGIGAFIFGVYILAAWIDFRSLHESSVKSGLGEIGRNLVRKGGTLRKTIMNLVLPFLMLLYLLPVSLFLPLALHPAVWRSHGESDAVSSSRWSPADRRMLRAIVGTVAMACGITMVCGLVQPRYSYVWVPLVCPAIGAVATAWWRRVYPAWVDGMVDILIAATAIAFVVGTLVMAILCRVRQGGHEALLWESVLASFVVAGLVIRWLVQKRVVWAGWGVIALILLAGPSFGVQSVTDRDQRSTTAVSQLVAACVPRNATVTTGNMLMDYPEIFYYAHVKVESHPEVFDHPWDFPTSRWVLLDDEEYPAWLKEEPSHLSSMHKVQIEKSKPLTALLAWYTPPDAARTLSPPLSQPTGRGRGR